MNPKTSISEARFDRIHNRTVIMAPKRARRPKNSDRKKCPGCFRKLTPPAVLVLPETAQLDGDDWTVRVVPNKFPCFSINGGNQRFKGNAGLEGIQDPAGRCEVVFETKRHRYPVYARTTDEIGDCFRALRSRYQAARSDSRMKFWFAFKNLGKRAGGTIAHEHWQLYSLPFIPLDILDGYGRAAEYYQQNGHSSHRRILDDEQQSGDRVVGATRHFLTFAPFAAQMPYELCIAPLRDSADFSTMTEEELNDFAGAFREAIERLSAVHPKLSFNVLLHTAAFDYDSAPWSCWRLAILPRLTTFAGVELGLNIVVNPVTPEEAASTLRAIRVN